MNIYDIFMAPLEKRSLDKIRKKLIPKAYGDILEIGAGTGVNFTYYNKSSMKSFTILDRIANKVAMSRAFKGTRFVKSDATIMPFEDNSFDCVVETLVLCSIDDTDSTLGEITRILKPDGIFIHLDHGIPKKPSTRRIFSFFAPLWRGITRSCRIDKDHQYIIDSSKLINIESGSNSSGIFYWGVSRNSKS